MYSTCTCYNYDGYCALHSLPKFSDICTWESSSANNCIHMYFFVANYWLG